VYQVGINKGIILRCTAYQMSRSTVVLTVLIIIVLLSHVTQQDVFYQDIQMFFLIFSYILFYICNKSELTDILICYSCL